MEELSDEELVRQYLADPASARGHSCLNQLFGRHRSRVAAWCFRLTGDVESAADLAQEVFLKAFQRIDSFREDARFTTWLYSISRNHCLDQLKSRAAMPVETTDVVLEQMIDSRSEDVSLRLERQQAGQLLQQWIRETLDKTEAEVMTLHYVQELPLDAITRLLRLNNPSGAKAYIVSARRKLSRGFSRWKNQEPGMRER